MMDMKLVDHLGVPPVVPWTYSVALIPLLVYLIYKVSTIRL